VITSGTVARAIPGRPFSYQITALNGVTAFNATGLPMGLSINKDTGLISGTPELTGLFVINLLAQNSLGIRSSTLVLTSGGTPVFLPFLPLLLLN
jgi:hypothetical protein